MLAPRGLVETSGGRFLAHGGRGFLHAYQHADRGLLPLHHTLQLVHVGAVGMSGLHADDDLLRLTVALVEVDTAVDAPVGAFLLVRRPRVDQIERPPLELVGVARRQALSIWE